MTPPPPWEVEPLPEAPAGAAFGYLEGAKPVACTREELVARVQRPGLAGAPILVWTPDQPRLVPPGVVPFLDEPLRAKAREVLKGQAFSSVMMLLVWGGLLLQAKAAPQGAAREAWRLYAIMALLLGVAPLVSQLHQLRRLRMPVDPVLEGRVGRYMAWLARRPARVTWVLVGVLAALAALQVWAGGARSVAVAGLVKEQVRAGEVWRLLSGPLLHAHPLHLSFNVLSLLALGRACEALTGRAHVAVVFVVSALCGSLASVLLLEGPSVGASGGLLGLVAFLLCLGGAHAQALPGLRLQALRSLVVTALAGVVASEFIDNAAHAGGALAGLGLGAWLTRSGEGLPLPATPRFALAGHVALAVLLAHAVLTAVLLVRG